MSNDSTSQSTSKEKPTVVQGTPTNGDSAKNETGATQKDANQTSTSQSSQGTGSTTGTTTTSGSLSETREPTPEEQFPQYKYIKPVHPEILASKAFKEAGFLPPKEYYWYPNLPNEEDYQWVGYMPKNGETFYSFWRKYGVQPVEIRDWNPQTYERGYASYGGQYWMLRIKASRLPHD